MTDDYEAKVKLLRAYGRHEWECTIKMVEHGSECTRGLDAALSPQEKGDE